ncbi:hypothetical protein [Microbacterium sp. 179-I 3D3 NHS]|uniref:hypothetical protein n=1 Tax=Microbacterium sp. 179-I 3D3 NHS TaxID=3142382 RepID=UPI0039A23674
MKNGKNRPALIAASTGLALCLGLGAVAASAAEISNGGFMVRAVDADGFEGIAGMKPKPGNGSHPGTENPGEGGSHPGEGGNEGTNPGGGGSNPGGGGEGTDPGGGNGANPGGGSGGEQETPEQPEDGFWGHPRIDSCVVNRDDVRLGWSYPDLVKSGEFPKVIVESEWLQNGEVVYRYSYDAVVEYETEQKGHRYGFSLYREDALVVGARARLVDAENPSRATSWVEFEVASGDTECTIK